MKKTLVGMAVICLILGSFSSISAAEQTANEIVTNLMADVQKITAIGKKDLDATKPAFKNMAEKGATREDLKNVLVDLVAKGLKGQDLKNSVASMSDLVNAGEKPKDAGSIVSQAVAKAHAQGLKGKELAAKVHEAIKLRKAEMEKVKKEAKEKAKKEVEKIKEKAKEQAAEVEGMGKGKSKGK